MSRKQINSGYIRNLAAQRSTNICSPNTYNQTEAPKLHQGSRGVKTVQWPATITVEWKVKTAFASFAWPRDDPPEFDTMPLQPHSAGDKMKTAPRSTPRPTSR
ncbi:uncharacterized protein TrAtP1_008201 [Trichoderma atroviride]|uniref:uncharacterized protein n=1 Tax=Hypocrea atroviridis TaxID=63577 RepID=UPI00331F8CC2|nr:hypothetical protein TrAtP1_008201 [Trichoderma atroviride]